MSKKQPNRLAELIDHQSFAGSALPQTLADNMQLYTQATNEIKTLLVDCLPEEILNTCWVVGLTTDQLTLSVNSTTAANHIRYLQNQYLKILTEHSTTFKQLNKIRVVVAKIQTNYSSNVAQSTTLEASLIPHKASKNQALSQNTKRTITQAVNHVITDKNLRKALLRLTDE